LGSGQDTNRPYVLREDLSAAVAALARDDDEVAVAALMPAVRVDRTDDVARFWLARVHSQLLCDDATAAGLLETAIELDCSKFEYWCQLATSRLALGDFAAAKQASARGFELQPHAPTMVMVRAQTLSASGQRSDAVMLLRTFARDLPDHLHLLPCPSGAAPLGDAERYYWEVVVGCLREDIGEMLMLTEAGIRSGLI
jgi:tetratricopeptide (TPR) repeat protein